MTNSDSSAAVLRDTAQLIAYYEAQAEDHEDLKSGVEWERFGVYADTFAVVPYLGEKGYLAVLQYLHRQKGWKIEDGSGDYIYTLKRGNARTNIEGDGKPEITGSPFVSLHDLAAEINAHQQEIDEISKELNILWLPIGLQPFADADQIPLVPKPRYQLWDRIFQKHHKWMHTYMKALAGTHLNFGYTSIENLLHKTQVLYRLSPLLAALFANSPFENGKVGKCLGLRRKKIFTGGPGQEKMMDGMLSPDFTFAKWVEWYLDRELIIFPFDQDVLVPSGWTFRTWMENGYENRFPTIADFDQHLKTRWTDIRFRPSYLEYRVFDSIPYPLLIAATAFVKGLLFDETGRAAVEKVTSNWTEETIHRLHLQGCKSALRTEINGRTFLEIAQELLEVSAANLQAFAHLNAHCKKEDILLEPLRRLLKKGLTPAEDLLSFSGGDPRRIPQWAQQNF